MPIRTWATRIMLGSRKRYERGLENALPALWRHMASHTHLSGLAYSSTRAKDRRLPHSRQRVLGMDSFGTGAERQVTQYRQHNATAANEMAYRNVVAVLKRHCRDHPRTTSNDLLAILGKAAGYCVGLHGPEYREMARGVVTTNMDVATKEVAGEQA
jgi:hypothetical protein